MNAFKAAAKILKKGGTKSREIKFCMFLLCQRVLRRGRVREEPAISRLIGLFTNVSFYHIIQQWQQILETGIALPANGSTTIGNRLVSPTLQVKNDFLK